MACDICAAKGWDHDEIVERCKSSVYWTNVILAQWERVEGSLIHFLVCAWLQWCIKTGKKDILLMLPRGFLKTSIMAGFAVWGWINNPERRILLIHASGEEAAKLVPVIQTIIMSDAVAHFFPSLVPNIRDVTWKTDAIEIPRKGNYREASLEARGVKSSITGGHFSWHFFDDIIDENISRSPLEVQRAIDFDKGSSNLFAGWEDQLRITTGTFWPGGFYEQLIESGIHETLILGAEMDDRMREFLKKTAQFVKLSPKWQEKRDAMLALPDGAPVWPEQFPEERLAREKIKEGPVGYARQILNLPLTDDEQRFRPEYFTNQYYNWGEDGESGILPSGEKLLFRKGILRATVDPGGDNPGADPSAVVVFAWYPEKAIGLVLQAWQGRLQPDRLIEKVFSIHERWEPLGLKWWGIEQAALQGWLRRFTLNEQGRRGIHFSIKPIPTGNKSKAERAIIGLQPFIANGQIFFLRNQRELVDELLSFRVVGDRLVGKSPNLVDALAMQATFLQSSVRRRDSEDPDRDIPEEGWEAPVSRHSPYGLNDRN